MKNCSFCGAENEYAAVFCEECGKSFYKKCDKCGAENKLSAKFCNQCGTRFVAPNTICYTATERIKSSWVDENSISHDFDGVNGYIVLKDGVDYIGENAFEFCVELNSVTIPGSVTSIGNDAFYGCSGLISVTVPDSVTYIGENAFYRVKNVVYGGEATGCPWNALNVNGYVDGDILYSDATKTKLLGCSTLATEVNIPDSVNKIGCRAFEYCYNLRSIAIPESVTEIGENAFCYCKNLATVYFNAKNCIIKGSQNRSLFIGCVSLHTLIIGKTVTNIPSYSFENCIGLTTIIYQIRLQILAKKHLKNATI